MRCLPALGASHHRAVFGKLAALVFLSEARSARPAYRQTIRQFIFVVKNPHEERWIRGSSGEDALRAFARV
jgi:hypothetical protein